MGLDVGRVRVGVALSDPMATFAQPHEVIDRRKQNPFVRIKELCEEYEVTQIVIGMPLTLAGEQGLATEAVNQFCQQLRQTVSVPVDTWDERLSTAQAEREMIAAEVKREARKQTIDQVAASLILQSYLDAQSS